MKDVKWSAIANIGTSADFAHHINKYISSDLDLINVRDIKIKRVAHFNESLATANHSFSRCNICTVYQIDGNHWW